MLRPVENACRESKRLDGLWDFALDPDGRGAQESWWRGPLPDPRRIAVPSSYNDLYVDAAVRDHVGTAWYQRLVRIPKGWVDDRIVLRFDSATHRASVWVDEHDLGGHEGGYTPFELEVTDLVRPGEEARITVAVDNELRWSSIPPGFVQVEPDGRRRQVYFHDFFNFAGLHRSVWLSATPLTYIDEIVAVTSRDGTDGLIRCDVAVVGDAPVTVRLALRDQRGRVVAAGAGPSAELRVDDVELWQPGAAYLYELTVDLVQADGKVLDRYSMPVGVRTVRVDGHRFLVNDEPVHLRGFGMHEDRIVRGKGHDDASMLHDLELLEWTGANSFRTSHYPYAEEWLDEADRRGLLVIDETAAVGLNLHGHGAFPFDDEQDGPVRQEAHQKAIEELIARDRNHPSVVLWSIANEPESNTEASGRYFAPLFEAARSADSTRPVGFVNMIQASAETCQLTVLADVVMVNRYYGWYQGTDDLVGAETALEADLLAWANRFAKPILVTEYGADALSGMHAALPVPWTEEYQGDLLDLYHRVFDRIDAVVGELVWNFADFATAPMTARADGNKKGVFTRDRRPKGAAHILRRRWHDV